jgi:hypothetical protein
MDGEDCTTCKFALIPNMRAKFLKCGDCAFISTPGPVVYRHWEMADVESLIERIGTERTFKFLTYLNGASK